jgi:hypothetical protein
VKITSNIIILLGLNTIALSACKNHSKFDRDDWNDGDGLTFAYRAGMVDDLLQNYKLKGLKYQEAIHLLHRPQQSDKTQMLYEILEVRKPGEPYHVKQLILSLKDSVVTDAKIYEHTDKK